VAVGLGGEYVDRSVAVRTSALGWRAHLDPLNVRGALVPLRPTGRVSWSVDTDRTALEVVAGLVARRASLRERLSDHARVRRLIDDMCMKRWRVVPFRIGGRRRVVEVLTAMRLLGYEHRFGGRPVPGEVQPAADEVVAAVLARVRANPHAQGISFDEELVRGVVERHYIAVEPWPVHALTD
jgi:hypothetical protein